MAAELGLGRRIQIDDLTELDVDAEVLFDLGYDHLDKPLDSLWSVPPFVEAQGTADGILQVEVELAWTALRNDLTK